MGAAGAVAAAPLFSWALHRERNCGQVSPLVVTAALAACTIADMISYPWTVNWQGQGQDISEFRYFKRWFDEISARPAVQRGLAVTAGPPEDVDSLSAEEKERRMKLLYGQRARPAPQGGLTA